MRIMKWLAGAVAALALLFGIALVAAVFLIPADRTFTNEIEINAPAEKVWQVIADKSRYPEWHPGIVRVEIIDEKNWVEYPKDSPEPIRFTIANDGRPASMEIAYSLGDSFHGHWHGEMTPTAGGVRLKTTDSYKAKGSLIKIPIGLFFDLDAFAKDWNQKLKARVESMK